MLNEAQQAARDQFNKQSDNYGKSHILADTSDIALALDGVALPTGSPALDVATGGGHTAAFLAEKGFRVTASDIAPAMLENARKLAAERGFQIEIALHEAEKFPFPNNAYDLVTCRVAAHHFSDPEAFVSEVARVLKPGGYFLLIDGSVPDDEPEAEEWTHRVEKLRDPSHGRFLTPKKWKQLCQSAGLTVEKTGLTPFKQPDLEWYFETAATTVENREAVRELVRTAPESARRIFKIAEENGKAVWWWTRLALLARKVS